MNLTEAKKKFEDLLMSLDRPPTLHEDSKGNIYLKIGESKDSNDEDYDDWGIGPNIGDLDDAMG